MLNRRHRGPLCWVMAFFTASYQQLLWTPTHLSPKVPRPDVAFLTTSRLLLRPISNCNSSGAPRPDVALPTTTCLSPSPTLTGTLWLLSWLSYIIVQHSLSHPLDFWNRMLDGRQAEITVMQFTGHSLPVHQSMSVPWEFFTSSHFISQFPPTRFPLITAIKMCYFLPVHYLGMAFLAGSKVKIQQIVGQTVIFNLRKAPNPEGEDVKFKPALLRLKNWLYITYCSCSGFE